MTTILQDRLQELVSMSLKSGSHAAAEKEFCVMEAVAYIAGEPHSDHPKCASPLITRMMISFNDRLKTDADRDRLIKPLVPELVGTRTTDADDRTRSYMAADWLIRQRLPIWLRLSGLTSEAELLEGLARVVDEKTAEAARAAAWTARIAASKRRSEGREALRAQLRTAAKPAAAYAYAYAAADAAYAYAYAAAAYAYAYAYAYAAADAAYAYADADADAAYAYAYAYAAADAAADAYADADADAAAAGSPQSVHADALRAAVEAAEKTDGDEWEKRDAAFAAAKAVYDARISEDETFAKLREETAKVQEGFVQLVKDMCAVGRTAEEVANV